MKNATCLLLLLVVAAMLLAAGCAQQQPAPAATPAPVAAKPADTIGVAASPLGTILVDAQGKTLYYFASDVPGNGASACAGQCAAIWPAFSAGTVQVSSPLDPADFSSITRADGTKQTTYYGWPLYYYASDAKPGDVNGENVLKVWFAIKPDESVLIAHTPALGLYLTDTAGKTLYVFAKDSAGASACTGTCTAKWPPFSADTVTAPSALKPADFSAVSRADGVKQTAYMGMPLYYYANDTKPGDTNGEGFNNLWYGANVSGTVPVVTTPPATFHPLSPTGGGSY